MKVGQEGEECRFLTVPLKWVFEYNLSEVMVGRSSFE